MRQCNRCANRKCDRIRLHRSKRLKLTASQMRQTCSQWIPIWSKTEKLFFAALATNAQGVHDVLAANGFKVIELADPPYFKFHLEKENIRYDKKRNRKRAGRDKRNAGNATVRIQHKRVRPTVARSDGETS